MDKFDFYRDVSSRYMTAEQIDRVRSMTIGIGGAGGLGSNCAIALARSGFCRFVIADFDQIEPSNLNRQAYLPAQIGTPKAAALADLLHLINPEISAMVVCERVNDRNALHTFGTCDVVIEAFDDPAAKSMLTRIFCKSGKLYVCASGIAGFGNSDRIVTRKISDTFYIIGDEKTSIAQFKPYAPCVAIAAAKQADVVLVWTLSKIERGD